MKKEKRKKKCNVLDFHDDPSTDFHLQNQSSFDIIRHLSLGGNEPSYRLTQTKLSAKFHLQSPRNRGRPISCNLIVGQTCGGLDRPARTVTFSVGEANGQGGRAQLGFRSVAAPWTDGEGSGLKHCISWGFSLRLNKGEWD